MSLLSRSLSRRTVLRGALNGIGVGVALPLLDCFLDSNGAAFADGSPLPVRFGTWFWALGMDKELFTPTKYGSDYDLRAQNESWADVKQHINLFSNYNVTTDGKPALCHYTGWVALRTGYVPATRGDLPNPTIDVLVADAIGSGNRFRSLECTATGSANDGLSFRSADAVNPAEPSPIEFYRKIFGTEFQDPNSENFKPSTSVLVQRSVLSGVREQSNTLMKTVGAADRTRLDQYFTSIRELEQSLELQLKKPPPAPSCKLPAEPKEIKMDNEIALVQQRYKLMSDILIMALACNQTRVFSLSFSSQSLTKLGEEKTHHALTHEEPTDAALGVQPKCNWFVHRNMEAFAQFIRALAATPEGSGTLLDNMAIYAHSDHEYARVHALAGIPMMTAGRAGGKLKTGLHLDGRGASGTQLGFTLLNLMGVPVGDWGTGAMKASKPISEILV